MALKIQKLIKGLEGPGYTIIFEFHTLTFGAACRRGSRPSFRGKNILFTLQDILFVVYFNSLAKPVYDSIQRTVFTKMWLHVI